MMFGLPGACYAMYKTAYAKEQPKVRGMLLASALTSFATGITEPIEFSFIFISPILWVFHAFMAGMSFLIMSLLQVGVGNAGGGFVDLFIFGILQGTYTKWYFCVILGIVYFFAYFFVFKYVIEKKNLKTPGRDVEDSSDDVVQVEASELGTTILKAIGGKENIRDIDNCISRLRLILNDTSVVDEAALKTTGSLGIIRINENNIELRIRITAKLKDGKVHTRLSAGIDGVDISFEARDLLRTIYLKPLRDAEKELSSGYRSRFAQILKHYPLFKKEDNEEHPLEKIANNANEQIEGYFSKENQKRS